MPVPDLSLRSRTGSTLAWSLMLAATFASMPSAASDAPRRDCEECPELVAIGAGEFTMGTNDAGDGAPPGKHQVAFVWVPPNAAGEAGQEAIIDDPSKLPKPSTKIPAKYGDPETSGVTVEVPPRGLTDLKFDLQ